MTNHVKAISEVISLMAFFMTEGAPYGYWFGEEVEKLISTKSDRAVLCMITYNDKPDYCKVCTTPSEAIAFKNNAFFEDGYDAVYYNIDLMAEEEDDILKSITFDDFLKFAYSGRH